MVDPVLGAAGGRAAGSVFASVAKSRFGLSAVMRVGSREERRDVYLRVNDAISDMLIESSFVHRTDPGVVGMEWINPHIQAMTAAGNEGLRSLNAIRIIGTRPVIMAAEDAVFMASSVGRFLKQDEFDAANARAVDAQFTFIEACRADLAYTKSLWNPLNWKGRVTNWWRVRKHPERPPLDRAEHPSWGALPRQEQ